ncbi:hypothetical protein D3C71_1188550 [compost metagenome]
MAVPIVNQCVGLLEAFDQQEAGQRQYRHRHQQRAPTAQAEAGPVTQAFKRRGWQQSPQRPRQHGVTPQVGQKPQVVPGRQQQAVTVFAAEAAIGAEVLGIERQIGFAVTAGQLLDHLQVRLRRYDDQHAKQQRQQQLARALAQEAVGQLAQQVGGGHAGDQEQQRHPPRTGEQHERLGAFAGMRAFDVPTPAHVVHAHVVDHQQPERDHAQPVHVMTSLHRLVSLLP